MPLISQDQVRSVLLGTRDEMTQGPEQLVKTHSQPSPKPVGKLSQDEPSPGYMACELKSEATAVGST